jgi:hypothetical protein
MNISNQPVNWTDEAKQYERMVSYVTSKRQPQKGDMVHCPGGIGIYNSLSICPYHLATGKKPNFPPIAYVLLLLPTTKKYENKLAQHWLSGCDTIIGTSDINFNNQFGLSNLIINQDIAKIDNETFILEPEKEVTLTGLYGQPFTMKPHRYWIHQKTNNETN